MAVAQEKKTGQGTTYSYAAAVVGQVKTITLGGTAVSKVDVTDLDSTIVAYIAGKPKEVKETTIEFFWTPGADKDETIDTALQAYTVGTHVVVFASLTTSKTATWSGFFTDFTPAALSGKEGITRTVTICPTSVIAWT